jgi:hypothetical protein
VVATLGLVACGAVDTSSNTGESDGVRIDEASSDGVLRAAGADDTSCPEQSSMKFEGHIMSGLPSPVTLSAPRDGWICADWSGVSTPGHAFNGKVMEPAERYQFRLERHRNAYGYFTLQIDGIDERSPNPVVIEGTSRLVVDRRGSELLPSEANPGKRWLGTIYCWFVPMTQAPESWGDTAIDDVFDAFWQIDTLKATMLIVHEGQIGLLHSGYGGNIAKKDDLCGYPKPSRQ